MVSYEFEIVVQAIYNTAIQAATKAKQKAYTKN